MLYHKDSRLVFCNSHLPLLFFRNSMRVNFLQIKAPAFTTFKVFILL